MKNSLLIVFTSLFVSFSVSQTALHFDGDNDYVNLNAISNVMDTLDEFSIDFWVQFDVEDNADYGAFFASNTSSNGNVFLLRIGNDNFDPVNGSAVVYINDSGNNYMSGITNIGDNQCHHIAFTYFNNACSLYVDGGLEASASHTIQFSSSDLFSLGQEYDGGSIPTSNFYEGSLDEFRIWNIAKDSNQIIDLMNLSPAVNDPFLVTRFSFEEGVASGNNMSISNCVNQVDPILNGQFHNFALNNMVSNYVDGNCSLPVLSETFDTTICQGPYISTSGGSYVESGDYSDTIFNGSTVESISDFSLTISLEDIDMDIHLLPAGELVSYDSLASFQWLYCEDLSPVPGETSSNFVASIPGYYALELTYNGCKDTTECYITKGIGLEEDFLDISISPNPSSGIIEINSSVSAVTYDCRVISSVGKMIEEYSNIEFPYNLSILQSGYFIIELTNLESKNTIRYPVVIH